VLSAFATCCEVIKNEQARLDLEFFEVIMGRSFPIIPTQGGVNVKRKMAIAVAAVVLTLGLSLAAFADKDLPVFKTGETVYVCGCGPGCDCLTMSRKAGSCVCNKPLVKTTINKIEGDKAFVTVNGKEQAFITKAKYACACGPGCDCGTISQKPGNCACGKPMKKVE